MLYYLDIINSLLLNNSTVEINKQFQLNAGIKTSLAIHVRKIQPGRVK